MSDRDTTVKVMQDYLKKLPLVNMEDYPVEYLDQQIEAMDNGEFYKVDTKAIALILAAITSKIEPILASHQQMINVLVGITKELVRAGSPFPLEKDRIPGGESDN